MNNTELLHHIMKSHKQITGYYPYRTGGWGSENEIAETDNFNGRQYDEPLKNFITLMVQLGAAVAKCTHQDNKTAVSVKVEGLDYPVYFYQYDGKFVITKAINSDHKEPDNIIWNVY